MKVIGQRTAPFHALYTEILVINAQRQTISRIVSSKVYMCSAMSRFDPIHLLCSSIPFTDPFSFVNGEFGEWPETESSRMMKPQDAAPLHANSESPSRRMSDDGNVEFVCIKQSKRWREAGFHRIVGACTKLESSYSEDSNDHAVSAQSSSSHAPRVRVSSLELHTRNSTDTFTPDACLFSDNKEDSEVCSYGNWKLAKLSYQRAQASPSLFDLGPQLSSHHVKPFNYNAACKSVSFSTSSRMEGTRELETVVHSLPIVLSASNGMPGRTRLNVQQAINIFNQRATKTKHTAALLAAEYGISSKAIRDIWSRRSWAEDTRPLWTHLDEESSNP